MRYEEQVWGDDWIERAQQVPFNLRDQICYHCGQIIAAGQECVSSQLKLEHRGPFSAHRRCHDFAWLIHSSKEEHARVMSNPRIRVKNLIEQVDDEQFVLNVQNSVKKLKLPKWRYMLNVALEWLEGGAGK